MHNIKSIRENPDLYKKKFEDRNLKVNFKDLLELDRKNREIIQKTSSLNFLQFPNTLKIYRKAKVK